MRFYTHFSNSTVAALEAAVNGKRYTRLPITGGATLKSNLVAARLALSNAVYAQLDAASKDGSAGRCIVQNGFTLGGGNLSWTNVYTNDDAAYNADPTVRPTENIETFNSTLFAADGGTISETPYLDAVAALEAVLTAVNMRTQRPINNLNLALLSLFHDGNLDYFGWDDHTPGTPQSITLDPTSTGAPGPVNVVVNWDLEHPADVECQIWGRLEVVQNTAGVGGGATSYDSGLINLGSAGLGTYNFLTSSLQGLGATYDVTVTLNFRETVPETSNGVEDTIFSANHIVFSP